MVGCTWDYTIEGGEYHRWGNKRLTLQNTYFPSSSIGILLNLLLLSKDLHISKNWILLEEQSFGLNFIFTSTWAKVLFFCVSEVSRFDLGWHLFGPM